jgi:dsRNA-specific ribonuclease
MFANAQDYTELCQSLGYQFKNKRLLMRALTRKSALIEGVQSPPIGDHQRLEFLGDQVIGLVVSEILFTQHPTWDEGQLTATRSSLVNNSGPLAAVAAQINLGDYLIVGKGEDSHNNVRENPKALSDAVEALFGAVFIDCQKNYSVVRRLIKHHWCQADLISNESESDPDSDIEEKDAFGVYIEKPNQHVFAQDQLDKALTTAIECCEPPSQIEQLLSQGANPNVVFNAYDGIGDEMSDPYTLSALQLAIRRLHEDTPQIVRLLLQHGAEVNWCQSAIFYKNTPHGEIHGISMLIRQQLAKPEKIYNQKTALHRLVALRTNETDLVIEVIRVLLDFNADVNLKDSNGNTALDIINTRRRRKAYSRLFADEDPMRQHAQKLYELLAPLTNTVAQQASVANAGRLIAAELSSIVPAFS